MPCHHFCRMLPTAAAVGRRCHVQRVCLLNVRRAQVCYLCHVVTNGGWIFPYIETPFLLHSLFFRMEFIERILPAVLHICALSSLSKPVQHTPAFLFFPPFFLPNLRPFPFSILSSTATAQFSPVPLICLFWGFPF